MSKKILFGDGGGGCCRHSLPKAFCELHSMAWTGVEGKSADSRHDLCTIFSRVSGCNDSGAKYS